VTARAGARVRRAMPSDRAAAVALWTALHREHEGQDARYRLSDDATARWATDFGTWARSDADRIWLAEADGEAVGLLTAHLYAPAPTFRPAVMVYVDDLYVVAGARGQGVAGLLLDEARAWAASNGATEIRAGVLAANPAGRAFWERQGAADFSVVVTIPLGGPVGP
jgi:GNAT superfamily N-acetyltransferase